MAGEPTTDDRSPGPPGRPPMTMAGGIAIGAACGIGTGFGLGAPIIGLLIGIAFGAFTVWLLRRAG